MDGKKRTRKAGDLLEGLKGCRIDARVTPGEGDSLVASLPQFGLVASGRDFDAAIDALHAELVDYCADYFGDFESYRFTDRIAHLPFLLRFALTQDERRRDLLLEEPTESPTLARATPIGSTVAASHERDMQRDPAYRGAAIAQASEDEDEPALGQFLSFLAEDAARHPERLGDVGELVAGDEDLLEGVAAGDEPAVRIFELWDFETGNAQGVNLTLVQALTVVREALERDGYETLKGLALVEVQSGRRRLLAQGRGLIPLIGEPIARG